MGFDPNAYLQKKQAKAFDPNAYLQSKSQAAAAPKPRAAETIQEMHPDLATTDRMIVKNLANSPETGMAYLQKQYPGHDFELNHDGEIKMRKHGEPNWNVVDPNTGIVSMDSLHDAGDVLYDVAGGIGDTAGVVAGAIGGAALGGAGAVPGAMAGGAASSAGIEALRQKLGKLAGVPQDVSGTDVAIAGAAGAFSPLLMGSGVAGAAEKGLIQKGWQGTKSTVLPWIGEKASGISGDTIKNYAKHMTEVDALGKLGGAGEYAMGAYNKLKDYVTAQKDAAASNLVGVMKGAGKKIDASKAGQVLENEVDALKTLSPNPSQAEQQIIDGVDGLHKKYFIDPNVTPSDVGPMDQRLREMDPERFWHNMKLMGKEQKWEAGLKPHDYHVKDSARKVYFEGNKLFDEATNGLSTPAKQQYAEAINLEKNFLPSFEGNTDFTTAQKSYKTLSEMDKSGRTILRDKLALLAENGGADLTKEMEVLNAHRSFGAPGMMMQSLKGRIPLAGGMAALGGLAGYKSGGGYSGAVAGGAGGAALGAAIASPTALKFYMKAALKGGAIKNAIADKIPQSVGMYMRNQTGQALASPLKGLPISAYEAMMNQQNNP
jgi:hypothetical protein